MIRSSTERSLGLPSADPARQRHSSVRCGRAVRSRGTCRRHRRGVGLAEGLARRSAISVSGGIWVEAGGQMPQNMPPRLSDLYVHARTASHMKKAGNPAIAEVPSLSRASSALHWWRWAESNRRPKALHPRHYMLSSSLNLTPEQHDVRSASRSQPALFNPWLTGSHHRRFRDDDPTSRARTQAISGLRP